VSRRRTTGIALFAVAALAVAVLLAAFASPFASRKPDGLNKVAMDHGFDRHAHASATSASPLAGYAVRNVGDGRVSRGLSGLAGVGITLVVAGALFGGTWFVVRRRGAPTSAPVSS
jgi:cobalt/nickel transport system permease protein